jgi:hypothetical protein
VFDDAANTVTLNGNQVWNRRTNTGGGGSPTTTGFCRSYKFLPMTSNGLNCGDKWNHGLTGN